MPESMRAFEYFGRWCNWHARRIWLAVGPLEAIALGLWTFVLSSLVWVVEPLVQDVETLQQLQAQPASRSSPNATQAQGRDDAQAFRAFLPSLEAYPGTLELLHQLLRDAGVSLLQADFKDGKATHPAFIERQAHLVLSGATPALRRVLDSLLLEIPNLAIDDLAYEFMPGAVDQGAQMTLDVRLFFRGNK